MCKGRNADKNQEGLSSTLIIRAEKKTESEKKEKEEKKRKMRERDGFTVMMEMENTGPTAHIHLLQNHLTLHCLKSTKTFSALFTLNTVHSFTHRGNRY